MLGSLYTGSSGVKAHSNSMTVTGSNIANVNTVGYKFNRVNFQDLLATSTGSGEQTSKGVKIGSIQNIQTQGSFTMTEMETDLAIDGNGFFGVRDKGGNLSYTRAGQFSYDKDGYLTSPDGLYLQARDVDATTNKSIGNLKRIKVLDEIDPPLPTGDGIKPGTGVTIAANLDSNALIPSKEMDFENVVPEMYNFSTSVAVFDNKGNEHVVNVAFRKMEDIPLQIDPVTGEEIPGTDVKNRWEWYALSPGEGLEGGVPGTVKALGGGFLEFTDDGRLVTDVPGTIAVPPLPAGAPPGTPPLPPILIPQTRTEGAPSQIAFNFKGSGVIQTIGFNFGKGKNPDDPADPRTGMDGITQFATESKIHNVDSDGNPAGKLENIFIRGDGSIEGAFDSGRIKTLGRIGISTFKASDQLMQKGKQLYAETSKSGRAILDDPGINGKGSVQSKTLERSNVELPSEFVRMIEGQRAFQANAKTVTTADEILSDTIQMKR